MKETTKDWIRKNIGVYVLGKYILDVEKFITDLESFDSVDVSTKNVDDTKVRQYFVYVGKKDGKIVYVGTTIQKPEDRWRWHKHNGKDLDFELIATCANENDMLDMEYELIKKYNPSLNKITERKQNFNVKLTQEVLDSRKGDAEWCQCCLKRRVRVGYRYCYYCSKM